VSYRPNYRGIRRCPYANECVARHVSPPAPQWQSASDGGGVDILGVYVLAEDQPQGEEQQQDVVVDEQADELPDVHADRMDDPVVYLG